MVLSLVESVEVEDEKKGAKTGGRKLWLYIGGARENYFIMVQADKETAK